MEINFKKMEKAGFRCEVVPDGLLIYPIKTSSMAPLLDLLHDEYGIAKPFASLLAEDIHEYQVLTALKY